MKGGYIAKITSKAKVSFKVGNAPVIEFDFGLSRGAGMTSTGVYYCK